MGDACPQQQRHAVGRPRVSDYTPHASLPIRTCHASPEEVSGQNALPGATDNDASVVTTVLVTVVE